MTTTDRLALEEVIKNGNRHCLDNFCSNCLDDFCSNCPFNTEHYGCGLTAIKRVFSENVKKEEEKS